MFCRNCGKQLPDGSRFCTGCGAPVDEVAVPLPPEAVAGTARLTEPSPYSASATGDEAPRGTPGQAAAVPPHVPVPPAPAESVLPPSSPQAAPGPPGKGTGGRAWLVALITAGTLLLVAAVALLLVFTVFKGNDTGRAKELVADAEELLDSVDEKGEEAGAELEALFEALYEVETLSEYEETAVALRSLAADARAELGEAIDICGKVESLEGVEDYKEYAGMLILHAKNSRSIVELIEGYLDYIGSVLRIAESEGFVDEDEIAAETEKFFRRVQDLGAKGDDLEKEAEAFKEEKGL